MLTETIDAATRREFLAMLSATAFLAACGSDGDDSSGTGEETGGGTRTVETTHGPVEIPTDPQRVVAMHDQLVGYAIASLGFEDIVGITVRDAADPTLLIRVFGDVPAGFEDLTDVGTVTEPNIEAIAALDPDLIIGLPFEVDPIYDQLSAIAPTVVIDLVEGDRPPFQRQRDLAAVVGVEEEMDDRLDDYGARLETVRAALGGTLDGVSYTYVDTYGVDESYVVRSPYSPGLIVVEDLGMVPAPVTADLEEYTEVALESVADYPADVIFLSGGPDGVPAEISTLLANTVAGRNGQVIEVSRDIWSLEVVEALFAALAEVEGIFADRDVVVTGEFTPSS